MIIILLSLLLLLLLVLLYTHSYYYCIIPSSARRAPVPSPAALQVGHDEHLLGQKLQTWMDTEDDEEVSLEPPSPSAR